MSYSEILTSELRNAKLDVAPASCRQLAAYAGEIEHWNKTVNLTALSGAALVRRLIVEPVWVGQHLPMSGVLADIGSGNGSPGIPLCITKNFLSVHLVEPRLKRAAFLRHVAAKLGLKEIVVDKCRVEEMPVSAVPADWIVLQAIDPTPALVQALRRISTETTRVVWITSVDSPPVLSAEKILIPESSSKVWIFRLDQI